MTLNVNVKFNGKLTHALKSKIKNLLKNSRKSANLHFDWLCLFKACKDLDEEIQNSYISLYLRVSLGSISDIRNLVQFKTNSGKSVNFLFDGLLLYKVSNVWAKKIQKSCIVKNDLWFQNDIRNLLNFYTGSWK